MKLYLISQTENNGWDSFYSAVVIAANQNDAANMDPSTGKKKTSWGGPSNSWCSCPENVSVKYLGESIDDEPGVVCASFNAG